MLEISRPFSACGEWQTPITFAFKASGITEKQLQLIGLFITLMILRVFFSKKNGKYVNPLLFNLIPRPSGASGWIRSSGTALISFLIKINSWSFGILLNAPGRISSILFWSSLSTSSSGNSPKLSLVTVSIKLFCILISLISFGNGPGTSVYFLEAQWAFPFPQWMHGHLMLWLVVIIANDKTTNKPKLPPNILSRCYRFQINQHTNQTTYRVNLMRGGEWRKTEMKSYTRYRSEIFLYCYGCQKCIEVLYPLHLLYSNPFCNSLKKTNSLLLAFSPLSSMMWNDGSYWFASS